MLCPVLAVRPLASLAFVFDYVNCVKARGHDVQLQTRFWVADFLQICFSRCTSYQSGTRIDSEEMETSLCGTIVLVELRLEKRGYIGAHSIWSECACTVPWQN